MSTSTVRLTSFSHGAGCACKLGPTDLAEVLRGVEAVTGSDLLVGPQTLDDAAVWRRSDGRALVATTDFFTPIVDDPRTWGRIAAANAASDVYAMGGTPLFALNLSGWPRDELPLALLGEVLAGGAEIAAAGGWLVVGGHTIDSAEPLYGQAVIGEVDEDHILRNATGQAGHALVLTKAIGTGLAATALKRGFVDESDEPYVAAVGSMTTLNDAASVAARSCGASACTDVTGFGLLGHLGNLARASGVAAEVDAESVPLLPGSLDLYEQGAVAGGTRRNVDHVRPSLAGHVDEHTLTVLCDAQTSGGLLFAAPRAEADVAVQRLRGEGHPAAIVGQLRDGRPGTLHVGGAIG